MYVETLLGCLVGLVGAIMLGRIFKWKNVIAVAIAGAMAGGLLTAFTGGFGNNALDFTLVETPEEFRLKVLESPSPVLVDFYTETCPVCRRLAPTLKSLSQEYDGKVDFVKVNVNKSRELGGMFKIQGVPTVILFSGGQMLERWLGAQPMTRYRPALNRVSAAQN